MQLLSNTFDNQTVQAISSVRPVPNDQHDILRWTPSKNGLCTTKTFTGTCPPKIRFNFPNRVQGAFSPKLTKFCSKHGKSRELPPLIKAFTWRLIRRALASAERAVEHDAHLFFHCNLPRAVWFSFTPPMRTDNLPQENDGSN